jgi:hypothetical protein
MAGLPVISGNGTDASSGLSLRVVARIFRGPTFRTGDCLSSRLGSGPVATRPLETAPSRAGRLRAGRLRAARTGVFCHLATGVVLRALPPANVASRGRFAAIYHSGSYMKADAPPWPT